MTVKRGEEELELKGNAGRPVLQFQTIVPLEGVSGAESQLREAWLKS